MFLCINISKILKKLMKPTLFVLAAGMGSRYGGLKQLDGVGPQGQTIMDYSIYDALQAGFGKIVFVIRHDFEDAFREKILSKYKDHVPVEIVFQSVDALPEGFTVPADRTKPWGTNHAIMMGESAINEPFAVINADDFYGRDAFKVIAGYLSNLDPATDKGKYCMVGFRVGNTMTENGSVSRGVCSTENGRLVDVVERTAISFDENHDYFAYSRREFNKFLTKYINTPKSEFFIPSVVDKLVKNGEATVDVLDTASRWFGVTYPEDRPGVVAKLAELHADGTYPDKLF